MAEQKMAENTPTGKGQKMHTCKMTDQKMHNRENVRTENGRNFTYWKIAENAHPESARTENGI